MNRLLQSAALGGICGFCITQWALTGRDEYTPLALAAGLAFFLSLARPD